MKMFCNRKSNAHKYTTVRKSGFLTVCFIILIILNYSCTETSEFSTGTDFVDPQSGLKILDTFKIDLSTVLLDSLWTSGTGMAFVGTYNDEELGKVNSISYFELGFPTLSNLSDEAVFDSAAFIFSYSGDSYGDTTSLMSINIHQITERLTLDESGYLYNCSTVPYNSAILGTKTFIPEPNSPDTLFSIPVNNFGETIFKLVQDDDEVISTSELFLDYLKGFVLTSGSDNNSAIIGLTADESHISFKIYYHVDGISSEEGSITIPFGSSDVQFNKIQCDISNPVLKKIRESDNIAQSSDIGNKAYLHGLIGLLPKIQFPNLQDLLLENRWKVLKAELICEPVKGSYDNFKLPDMLYLYDTDASNEIISQLYNSSGYPITSTLTIDEFFNEGTSYTFDITSFIIDEFSDSYVDYEHGLFLGLEGSELISTFGRLLIEGKNPTIMLRLYYLTY
jgi:hypothetical protein